MAARIQSAGDRSMHWMLASAAIAMLLLSGAADAQTAKAKVIRPKAPAVSPVAKPAPKIVKGAQVVIPQPQQDVEAEAYSDLVDNVSGSLDQFAEDNVTGNQGRDDLDDSDADDAASKEAASETEKKPRR
jgi:LPS O-antigen subunit length determinant protein (WzzB/FepE family)